MHCLVIGITAPVFELYGKRVYELSEEENRVFDAIKNHRILISEGIIKYYEKSINNTSLVESFIDAYGNTERIKYVTTKEEFDSEIEELLYCVSCFEMRILVGEKQDVAPYSVDNIDLVQTSKIKKGKYTSLSKFVFPVNYHVKPNCSCESIARWFGTLFKGEKKIRIFDKYILNRRGIKCLKQYYLPNMDEDAEIIIYTSITKDFGITDLENASKDSFFDSYNVSIYKCEDMAHDRYIELSRIRINIGGGLDILEGVSIRKEKECDIDVAVYDKAIELPKQVRKIR